jgi:hypothetical protein
MACRFFLPNGRKEMNGGAERGFAGNNPFEYWSGQ